MKRFFTKNNEEGPVGLSTESQIKKNILRLYNMPKRTLYFEKNATLRPYKNYQKGKSKDNYAYAKVVKVPRRSPLVVMLFAEFITCHATIKLLKTPKRDTKREKFQNDLKNSIELNKRLE